MTCFARIAALLALLSANCAAQNFPSPRAAGVDEDRLAESMRTGSYGQNAEQNWDARLKPLSGSVSVKTRDSGEWAEISEETPLESSDEVRTDAEGAAELYLDDKGVYYIGRNTELEVSSIGQQDMSLSVRFGALVAKINKLLNSKFKMEVRTPTAVCAVRGTEFAVEYSRLSKDTGVAVYDEGRLAVTPLDESGAQGTEQVLEKNTELTLAATQKRFHAGPISRMMAHRAKLAGLRTAVRERRRLWKRLSPAARAELRQKALRRKILRRQVGAREDGGETPPAARKAAAAKKAGALKKAKAARKAHRAKKAPPPQEEE